MSNKNDLKYMPIDHGRTNTGRIGNVYYDEENIRNVRKQSSGDKARISQKKAYRKLVRQIVFTSVVGLIITISYFTYKGEKDDMNMNKQDQYVSQIGSIMNNYSEEDIIAIAKKTIEVIPKKGGKQEHIDYINECLDRLPYLKGRGMKEEVGMRLRDIIAVASYYDIYLPGYNYTMPSFPEYFVDGAIDFTGDAIDAVKSTLN